MEKQEHGIRQVWHFLKPTVIAAAVVLILFFALQGIPMNQSLDRRMDIESVRVTQNGEERILTEQEEIKARGGGRGNAGAQISHRAEGRAGYVLCVYVSEWNGADGRRI